jgi:hypothetical protein
MAVLIYRAAVFVLGLLLGASTGARADTTGIVAGYVRFTNGSNVTGAVAARTVRLCGPAYCEHVRTSVKGFYAFLDVPPGGYALSVERRDFFEYVWPFDVCVYANEYRAIDIKVLVFRGNVDFFRTTTRAHPHQHFAHEVSSCTTPFTLDELDRFGGLNN